MKIVEKLEEIDDNMFATKNISDIKNLLKNKPKAYRGLFDKNLGYYYIGDAYQYIHLDLITRASINGFYPDFIYPSDLEDYLENELDKGNILLFSFYPAKSKRLDLEKSSDGYTRKYVYDFGTIYAHEKSKLENFEIYTILGDIKKKEEIFETMHIKKLNQLLEKHIEKEPIVEALESTIEAQIDDFMANYGKLEFYTDYNDKLSKETIAEICEDSDFISDAFYQTIDDFDWFEESVFTYQAIYEEIPIDDEYKKEHETEIKEYLEQNFPIDIPYNHYNVETGWDCYIPDTSPVMLEEVEGRLVLKHEGIKKLIELQGHTVEEFETYINDNQVNNEFFDSLYAEIENATYEYDNQVVFLLTKDILGMADIITDNKILNISKNTTCGLIDPNKGAGSMMEIKLEKDMQIPANQLDIHQKDSYHYNVDETYGLVATCWKQRI